jgi:superfamily II DNA or RNA helicase
MYEHDFKNRRVLILSHRNIINDQIIEKFIAEKNEISIKKLKNGSKKSEFEIKEIFTVSTIQTAVKHAEEDYGLIIIDEAHHVPSDQYQKLLNRIKSSKTELLGFSATPDRSDQKRLYPTFNKLITSKQIIDFVNEGYLSKYEHYVSATYKLTSTEYVAFVNKKDNEFDLIKYEEKLSNSRFIADIIDNHIKYCNQKKTLIYAINIKHGEEILNSLMENGIDKVALIHSKLNKTEIDSTIDQFKNNHIDTLINIEMFTEGFDLCSLDCVILARPTMSLTLYLQMMGRALRIDENNPDKKAIILDIVNNAQFHGYLSEDRSWGLFGNAAELKDDDLIPFDDIEYGTPRINQVDALVELKDSSEKHYNTSIKIIRKPYLSDIQQDTNIPDKELRMPDLENELNTMFESIKKGKAAFDFIKLKPYFLIDKTSNTITKLDENNPYDELIYNLTSIEHDVKVLTEYIKEVNSTSFQYNLNNNSTIKFNELATELEMKPTVLFYKLTNEVMIDSFFSFAINKKIIDGSHRKFNIEMPTTLANQIRNRINM